MEKLKEAKRKCVEDLRRALPMYAERLNRIDGRLTAYIEDAISNNGSHANLYELLGIRKELRLMASYDMDDGRVQRSIRAIEGMWKDGRHVKGGLKFDTPRGNQHVRLMDYQVWCLFGIYAFTVDVSMEREYHEGDELLPTESVRESDGMIYDTRRLTTEAHIFQTRKSGKTEFGAAIDFTETCFLGPANAQALICTNSREQSKIAYKAIKEFAYQIDPTCMNKMGGKYFRVTADEMNWQPGLSRKGEIKVMSAGGKKKDGLYAYVVHADEHGQSDYINGKSDMQALVDVCWGSCGPRREKLLLHTTTAGLVNEGPYKSQLQTVEEILLTELDHPLGEPCRTPDDTWFAFLLRLDPWEVDYELDQLDDPELFRKVNRSIGTTVQPTWYKERLHAARNSEDTKKEVLTKDFNIWQGNRVTTWLNSDQIRPHQRPKRITDCKYQDGWQVFVGLDFGGTNDLWAHSYLAVNYRTGSPVGRFFADCTAWITQAALDKSPNRPLYERWIADGWLHVCPGEVMEPDLAINEMMQLNDQKINLYMFGYDPAQSVLPINTIKAWLQSIGLDAQTIKRMVVPVSQSFLTTNGLLDEIEYMLLNVEPWLELSDSPLWPWQFGNCRIEESTGGLRKVLKSTANQKVDNIHALLDALYCFDFSEGNLTT